MLKRVKLKSDWTLINSLIRFRDLLWQIWLLKPKRVKWEAVGYYHEDPSYVPIDNAYSETHYMSQWASQITSFAIVYLTVYSGADQRKHQSSASLASVRGIHRWPVNSPHKWPVTRQMFPFDDVTTRHMIWKTLYVLKCMNFTARNAHYLNKILVAINRKKDKTIVVH